MTRPVRDSKWTWGLRVVATVIVLWSVYRHLLRPDWSVRITVGTQVFDTYQRFWLWESPDASEHGGVLGGIRWAAAFSRSRPTSVRPSPAGSFRLMSVVSQDIPTRPCGRRAPEPLLAAERQRCWSTRLPSSTESDIRDEASQLARQLLEFPAELTQ
jgi:hypothetical protein